MVPSSGFYEWSSQKGMKQAFHIHPTSSSIVYFAGLWSWTTRSKAALVILTTASEDWMRNVHHRQPILLDSDGVQNWISGQEPNLKSAHEMSLSKVGPFVNKVGHDGPKCWVRYNLYGPIRLYKS